MEGEIVYPENTKVAIINSKIVPVNTQQISPQEIVAQLKSVVCLPYMGTDADKIGMTLIEAALFSAAKKAAEGDLDALNKLLDRLLGKPLQQVASLNVNSSLKELLDGIIRADEQTSRGVDPFSD